MGSNWLPTLSGIMRHGAKAAAYNYNGRPGQQRRILTQDQAISIYLHRKSPTLRSSAVAALFGVNPKTVRDIWNRRTWAEETQHLWEAGEEPVLRSRRRVAKFGRAASTSSSKAGGTEAAYRTASSSTTVSTAFVAEASDIEDWIASDTLFFLEGSEQGASEEWGWECGCAPLCDGSEDPFLDD
eukprot:CAMPEP_0113691978 /NCGR_PEP_ID=MMETSP0038_2-20120614/18801_1 /TAXON_ID=2898 /ORGANISM="Cryptomonas paramecium" /LENGTH=183 /DNA_ID=CAMNT_0000613783 /DNA_START=9 /DNA_END=560 /DNA_ORIENTATION=- /assembly_acc=CAM_ASM_000170